MTWQDAVLMVGSVLFLLALVPTVRGAAKPAPATSFFQGSVLLVFAATYTTLDLYFTAAITAVTGAVWLLILAQTKAARRG